MTDDTSDSPYIEAVPAPERSSFWVWLIPIIALVIAGWLLFNQWQERGPLISVSFVNAEGLEPGRTIVRYKDVAVGKLEKIELAHDLGSVIAYVRLSRNISEHLSEFSRFWVVRPRVSAQGISGLSTLVSGAFIAMDPGQASAPVESYTGLESPPVLSSEELGRHFILSAEKLGSIDVGSPVYFRQIPVGEVIHYALSTTGANIDVQIFIRAPYYHLVQTHSVFWNISGIDFRLDASGVSTRIDSLASLISGGLAFDTELRLHGAEPAQEKHLFTLHASRSEADEPDPGERNYYQMYFNGSLRGLEPGAPIEFRGQRIGTVESVRVELDPVSLEARVPVLVALEPERLEIRDGIADFDSESLLKRMVANGLRAQLKMASLLTGAMYIDLVTEEDAPLATIQDAQPYPIFPTTTTQLEEVTKALTELLETARKLPLEEITADIHSTIKNVRDLTQAPELRESMQNLSATLAQAQGVTTTLSERLGPLATGMDSTISEARKTLSEIRQAAENSDNWLGRDSLVLQRATRLMDDVSNAARSIRELANYLQRNPSSVIYGKGLFKE